MDLCRDAPVTEIQIVQPEACLMASEITEIQNYLLTLSICFGFLKHLKV